MELTIHRAKAVALSPPDQAFTEAKNALLDGAGVSFAAASGAMVVEEPAGSDAFIKRFFNVIRERGSEHLVHSPSDVSTKQIAMLISNRADTQMVVYLGRGIYSRLSWVAREWADRGPLRMLEQV